MKKHIFNQKGVSMIEILATSAIIGFVAVAAGSFLLTNLFSFNTASDNITLEREGRAVLNTVIDSIRESSGVASVATDAGEYSNEELGALRSSSISATLIRLSDSSELIAQNHELKLNGTSICSLLDSGGFKVQPLPEGESFSKCTGLRINLTLGKNKKIYNLESEAYFRNK